LLYLIDCIAGLRRCLVVFALAAVLTATAGSAARAQVPPLLPDTAPGAVVRVGEISVQAVRPVTTAGGASALEVLLDSLSLPAAPTLEQVLRELPLVQVRTNSRGEAQFSLRGSGSDARQVAVLVDGVPLNLTWDARTDLSVLPATAAGTLTLIRGLPSMLHGPNVLGGVVEVGVGHHPGHWLPPRSTEAGVDVAHTGAYSMSASASVPLQLGDGWLSIRGGGGYRDRPGHALAAGVTQPAMHAGTRAVALRSNTDLRHADGFAALRYLSGDGAWATFSSSGFRAERGIAAELHAERPRFWRYPHVARTVAVLSGGTGGRDTPFGGRGDLEASVGYDVGRSELLSYRTAAYADVAGTEDGDDRTLTLRLLGDHTLGRHGDLRAAFTYADITHDETISGAAMQSYRQRLWSMGAETIWSAGPLPGAGAPLRVSVSSAVDGADTPRSADKPPLQRLAAWGGRVGATQPTDDGRLLLHAGLSRRSRFPALRELYSGALGRFAPNPGLEVERLTAAEAGFTRVLSTGELQVVGFYRSLADAIERVTLPNGMFQRVNAGTARSTGVELLLSGRVGDIGLSGDLTLQRVRLYRGGSPLPLRPEYQPDVLAGGTARLPLPFDIRGGLAARYMGVQHCADPNRPGELVLPASARFDADVARTVRIRRGGAFSTVELRAAAENAANAAIYDQCGLPQPGRTLRLQLRARS
jgi:iron complex outermembrane recepter protein